MKDGPLKRDTNWSAPLYHSQHHGQLDTTWKHLEMKSLDKLMHARFLFHHSNLQLAYTTQAWNFKFIKNQCHASKHMKCTFKCTIQVHELAPPTVCSKFLIDSFPLSYLSPYVKFSPFVVFSPSQYTLMSLISFVSLTCTNFFVISPPITYIFVSLSLCHQ